MRQFIAPTENFIKTERTALTADTSAGSNVALAVLDNSGITQNTFIVIGYEGAEKTEICRVNASVTPGTALQVASCVYPHKANDPITVFKYDKRKFYGCVTATGSFVELTSYGSPTTIQVDDPQGTLFEYTGSEGYLYFKSTYYNSYTSTETDIADSIAVSSDQTGRYCSLYEIRVQAGLTNNPYINDARLEGKRIEAENEINSVLFRLYTLPLTEVPGMVTRLCYLLAAGYVDFEEYGPDGQGVKWLGEARSILSGLKEGTRNLIGLDGTELARKTLTQGIISYPNSVDDTNGPRQYFKMGQRF